MGTDDVDDNEEVEDDDLDDDDDRDTKDKDEADDDGKKVADQLRASRNAERKTRKALKAERAKSAVFEARLKAVEEGKGTEGKNDDGGKLARERDEARADAEAARADARKVTTRLESTTVAEKLGFKNPSKAYRLLDSDDVEYDEDGEPTNLRSLLRQELRDDPSLKRRKDEDDDEDDDRDADAGRGRTRKRKSSEGDGGMNDAIREAAGR